MIRPLLSLERLSLDEKQGRICYQYGKEARCQVDSLVCPQCGGKMKIIAFLTDYAVVDKIIDHFKLRFVAQRPPPRIASQELLMFAEASPEYFS